MKSLQVWLNEYGESHRNKTNKTIHWICVPLIFFSICGFLYGIKLPIRLGSDYSLNLAIIALTFVYFYYALLSFRLSLGMLLFALICLFKCYWLEQNIAYPLWQICLVIFVLAWIGQFYGHKIEGKKPSFLKDIQFLLIGPAWLMSFIFRKLRIRY